jgi:dihydrofolate reductase
MERSRLKPLAMVAAMTPSRVIGRAGGIPWHYPEDMKHFRNVTRGHALIMGRGTYDSIGKALPKRRTIVVSRHPERGLPDSEVVSSLDAAIELAREHDDEPQILGGAQIYEAALPLATRLILTFLETEHPGDVYFPEFDPADWIETERRTAPGLCWVTLVRR